MPRSPSIVPEDTNRDVYLVLDHFGVLGRVWREVEGDLAVLPAVRAEDGLVAVPPGGTGFQDDLAKRRLRRTS